MLYEYVYALIGCPLYYVGTHEAALQTVLRVIFKVAAAKRRTVSVCRRAVPVGVEPQPLVADHFALFIGKFGVPGGGDDYFTHPCPAIGELSWAVGIRLHGLADHVGAHRCEESVVAGYSQQFIPGKLVHELHPLFIFKGNAKHFLKLYGRLAVHAAFHKAVCIGNGLRPAFGHAALFPYVLIIFFHFEGEPIIVIYVRIAAGAVVYNVERLLFEHIVFGDQPAELFGEVGYFAVLHYLRPFKVVVVAALRPVAC